MKPYLEIGPGSQRLGSEWATLDCIAAPHIDHVATWGSEPLPFSAGQFDLVYAAHVLEHIPWTQSVAALREVHRILRPGGAVEIWVPNFRYIVECYLECRCGDDWRHENPTNDYMLWAAGRVFTYGPAEPNWHKAIFDVPHLTNCLFNAGFHQIEVLRGHERGHRHGPISLGMKAIKPFWH